MNSVPIFKYHGLGNDFVVARVDDLSETHAAALARVLCDRHRGVGADGVLLLSDGGADADVRMVIFNRDGSRPEMCGNGVRCVVRHLVQVEGHSPKDLTILSDAGLRRCEVTEMTEGTWQVKVEMGRAQIAPERVHVQIADFDAEAMAVDMGNPHAVIFEAADVETIDSVGGALNDAHPDFPEGVNVEFVDRLGPNRLQVDVFERGVGRTMACGTGACAAAAASIEAGVCDPQIPVDVELPGGLLRIALDVSQVSMTGPVDYVFCGHLSADWLISSGIDFVGPAATATDGTAAASAPRAPRDSSI